MCHPFTHTTDTDTSHTPNNNQHKCVLNMQKTEWRIKLLLLNERQFGVTPNPGAAENSSIHTYAHLRAKP